MAYRAKQSFVTRVDGKKRSVSRGTVVSQDDPVRRGREDLFADVEQATAAPGEKRTTRRGRKPKSSEQKDEKAEDQKTEGLRTGDINLK